jgi:hypothetical protein
MSESTTPAVAPVDATVEKKKLEKPEKPDEEAFKANLKKAEKEHADAVAKFVSNSSNPSRLSQVSSLKLEFVTEGTCSFQKLF